VALDAIGVEKGRGRKKKRGSGERGRVLIAGKPNDYLKKVHKDGDMEQHRV